VIARPIVLYIFDLPIFGIPLAVFPNKGGGRHSGWIMPSFGNTRTGGTYFHGLGYFWAPNDYFDGKLLVNFRDEQGLDFKGRLRYKKRYYFNGIVDSELFREVTSGDIVDLISGEVTQQWKMHWKHSQIIDPTQNLSVDFYYVSDNRLNQDYGWDLSTRLQQRLKSSAYYSKTWPGTKNSLSISLSEDYDLLATVKLPVDEFIGPGQVLLEKTGYCPG